MEESRIFGPPGTGKTSSLATTYIPAAVKRYGKERIMVVSFTRAAAIKIAHQPSRSTGMPIDIPKGHVGTLHSICFHMLGEPKILETDKGLIQRFNEMHPVFSISGKTISSVDEINTGSEGDRFLNIYNIKRNRMVEKSMISSPALRSFITKWEQFKSDNNVMDFTDLIETCLKDRPYAPDHPEIIFVDEAQDMTKLQIKLVRSWGQDMHRVVLVGDDDQAIYLFSGADPRNMLEPSIKKEFTKVLDQSYRVPQKILDRANSLISKVTNRKNKKYMARKDKKTNQTIEGKVHTRDATWKYPDELITEAKDYVKQNKTVMFLASCSYMLEPLKKKLREQGIPFHNPYRRQRGDWNPLHGGGAGIQGIDIIKAFLGNGIDEPYWNIPQLLTWAKYIKVGDEGLIRKQGKEGITALENAIENNEQGLHTSRNVLTQIITETAAEKALNRDIAWFLDTVQQKRMDGLKYPVAVYEQNGLNAIENQPLLTIGTIHSVKGAEADCVFLFPDISWQAASEMRTSIEGREYMYRVFYVGMTRAKEELILTEPAVKRAGSETRYYIKL